MYEIIEQYNDKWNSAYEYFIKELKTLSSNRAHASLIEDIKVNYYDTPTPLKQIATITIPEPRQMLVEAWDNQVLKDIETALQGTDNGFAVVNDGSSIRVTLPDMTEETRKQTVQLLHKKTEEARVSIRKIREDILKQAKTKKESGEISEDEFFDIQKKVQEIVDKFNASIKEDAELKEKEIMTV